MKTIEELTQIIENFRKNWTTKNGHILSLTENQNIKNIDDVYRAACQKAHAPSVLRALTYPQDISSKVRNELKEDVLFYLENRLNKLFKRTDLDFCSFDNWEKDTVSHIVKMYKDKNIDQYTYGNGQKLVNMAIKFVLSSNLVKYDHPVFKYCHIPVDGIIQKIAKEKLEVELLHQNGAEQKTYSSWSKNDCRNDFLDYQKRIRESTQKQNYYSPLIWEIKNWRP